MADPSMICAALCGFMNNTGLPAATARRFSSCIHIRRNRKALTEAIEDLRAVQKMVEEKVRHETNQLNECDHRVSKWMIRVNEFTGPVNAIGQECDQLMQYSCFWGSLSLGKRYHLGKRVLKVLEDLGRLIKEGEQFQEFGHKPEPDLVEDRPRIEAYGIKPVLKNLREFFNSSSVGIIGVWGPGGVGKTTLLNTFNNELKELGDDYQVVIMIEVSNYETLNIAAIQHVITDRLGLPWNGIEEEQTRARILAKALGRKQFIILLDDVGNVFQLEDIGIPAPDSKNKSKLILTSRDKNVCYQMGAHRSLIKMEYLEKESAWELFRSNLGTEAVAAIESPAPNNVVRQHAEAIVRSCGGLPLALKVIGRAVAGHTEPSDWSSAVQATKDDITDLDGVPDMLLKLKYSYDKLTETQQQCFLYCTLFPEYGSIRKDKLVEYWMADGLIPQDPEKGHHIIRSLLSACLLESRKSDSSEVKMHHIIRHLGISLAGQEYNIVKAGMNLEKAPSQREWQTAKRISLMFNNMKDLCISSECKNLVTFNNMKDLCISPECKNLVTLLVQHNPNLESLCPAFFESMPSLRVLDLSHTSITTLPLCKALANLKYLNLSHTCIESLPEEFWVLKELTHLDLSVTKALKDTFDNCSKLHKLRVLNLFRSNYGIRDVNDLNIHSLKELKSLGITIYAEDVLKKLTKASPPAKSTQHLSLKHCEKMQSIQISDFTLMVQLGELYVESCPDLTQLIADSDEKKKSCLQVLTLAKLPALQTIQIGSSPHHFRNLLEITISKCQKLHDVTWVLKLESLEKLYICHCHELEQIVQDTDETWIEYNRDYQNMTRSGRLNGIQNHVDFPKLRSLVLTDLPKLRRICIPRDFPCLESIMVEDCPNLTTIPLGETYDCPRLNRICGSNTWWHSLEWGGNGIMESKYFISIQDKD